jgi:AcrR family transcriptional regulator
MPPKVQFEKQQIIDAAFEIARSEGIDQVTIRKVAERVGSSIAPIYVNFNDVQELKGAVFARILELSQQMIAEEDSGSPFQDIGAASLRFARQNPMLFRDLVMKNNVYIQDYDQDMAPILLEQMRADPQLNGFNDEELLEILLKMRIFQLGLSVMAANDLLPQAFDEARMIEILESAAADVVAAARLRKTGTLGES